MINYKLNTKNKFKETNIKLDIKKNKGYKVIPKNKIKYEGVVVNEMCIINSSLIEKILRRKISLKLDKYLQYIITVLDDEESDAGRIATVLSDLNRYREMVNNKYIRYLSDKYMELLLKKIELLEYELKKKLMSLNAYNYAKLQRLYESDVNIEERKRSR